MDNYKKKGENMNYSIKEIKKEDLNDYMYVNTYAWNETYRNIMLDEFLERNIGGKDLKENVY